MSFKSGSGVEPNFDAYVFDDVDVVEVVDVDPARRPAPINLKNLFLNDYHNNIYFEVVYVIDELKEENHIFGRRYKFDFLKENENMKLSNFDFDYIN